jgi:tetratricopeptide (TPR) repeat protein
MFPPRGWLWLWLLFLGCRALPGIETEEETPAAVQLWEKGQFAMRHGQPDVAIQFYEQSLAADPSMARNHLSLAAAFLEKNDSSAACEHLRQFVAIHPEQLVIRCRYAELLWRLHRLPEAQTQFERFVADAQEAGGPPARNLIHSHSRLTEIGEEVVNPYLEHLHRGIGLFLLARERSALPDPEGELSVEGLLCKAAAELTLARQERPDEARPCWYLYEVWSQLGQRHPALRRLREANAAAPFSYLTTAEERGLYLAYQRYQAEQEVGLRNSSSGLTTVR